MTPKERAISLVKREMKSMAKLYMEGYYNNWDEFDKAMSRIFGFTQGVYFYNEDMYDVLSSLWNVFHNDMMVLRGIYKTEVWERIDGVFEESL